MRGLIIVKAAWDPEAKVFVAESDDVPGLVTEAETIEALRAKLPGMIQTFWMSRMAA
jgi:predicted RNase H-like HicB family nuclease